MRHKGNKHRPSVPKTSSDVMEARRENQQRKAANRRRRREQREAADAAGDGIRLPDPEILSAIADGVKPGPTQLEEIASGDGVAVVKQEKE